MVEQPRPRRWPIFVVIALFALAGFGMWKKQRTARFEAERAAAEAEVRSEEARKREARQLRYANAPPPLVAGHVPAPAPAAPATSNEQESRLSRLQQESEREFRSVDANGDGYISIEEARGRLPALAQHFKRVDQDGDGRISQQEFLQAKRQMLERRLAR